MKCPHRSCHTVMVQDAEGFECPACHSVVRLYQHIAGDELTLVTPPPASVHSPASESRVLPVCDPLPSQTHLLSHPAKVARTAEMVTMRAEGKTLQEIADAFEVTRECVRQNLKRAANPKPAREPGLPRKLERNAAIVAMWIEGDTTQQKIADAFGITSQRVSQILKAHCADRLAPANPLDLGISTDEAIGAVAFGAVA